MRARVRNGTGPGGAVPAKHRAASRLLVRTARHGGGWLLALGVAGLGLAAAETALPAVLGRAVDTVVSRASGPWLAWVGLLVALLVACDVLDDLAAGGATASSTAWLRRSVLHHLLRLDTPTAGRFTPGDLASRLAGNAADAGRVAPFIVRSATGLLLGLGSAVALALIDPWLCVTFLAGMPLLTLVVRTFAREASVTAEHYLDVQGRIAARLVDAVSGARTIAAAGTVERETQRVLAPLPELQAHGREMWRQQGRFAALDALIPPLLAIAVLAVAGAELARGRITPGEMLAAGQYALLGTALTSAVTSVSRLVQGHAAAGRAAEVLREAPVAYGEADLPEGRGRLEFRGVGVRIEGRQILDGVDLAVPAGTLVALVGRTGAGKSLLARLAGRLADPDEGEVLLDGVALPLLKRDALRSAVTYAFERPALIGQTIEDVIAFGPRRPSLEEVAAAARAAQADAFIRRMPEGYRTPLARAPMSGGESQRIGLARAFAHAGRVLVLDDVAASLDTVTEHEITRVLTGELADRTRLVIAHRASTAAHADAVVWLERGRVRAVAPHRVLWGEAAYRALFESGTQAAGTVPEPAGRGEVA